MNRKFSVKQIYAGLIILIMAFAMNSTVVAQGIPNAKIIVVDNRLISSNAAVAVDISRQVRQIESEMQVELQSEQNALQAEQESLQSQINMIPQEAYNQRAQEFQLKVNQYQQNVQRKRLQLERALVNADAEVERALKPILQNVLQQTGATILMDKTIIIEQSPGLDVTTQVIEQLDLAMPSLKVVLPDLPEAAAPPAAAPAAQQ